MNEIPEDIIAAGNRFQDLFGDGRQGYVAFDIAVLAIMAERERCAAVAIEYDGGGRKNNDVGWALSDVAAAIRQGQAKEGESA